MPKRRRIEIKGFAREDTRTVHLIVDSKDMVLHITAEPFARAWAEQMGAMLDLQVCNVLQEQTAAGVRIIQREILRG